MTLVSYLTRRAGELSRACLTTGAFSDKLLLVFGFGGRRECCALFARSCFALVAFVLAVDASMLLFHQLFQLRLHTRNKEARRLWHVQRRGKGRPRGDKLKQTREGASGDMVEKHRLCGDLGPHDHTGKSEIGWPDNSARLVFCSLQLRDEGDSRSLTVAVHVICKQSAPDQMSSRDSNEKKKKKKLFIKNPGKKNCFKLLFVQS